MLLTVSARVDWLAASRDCFTVTWRTTVVLLFVSRIAKVAAPTAAPARTAAMITAKTFT